MQVVTPGDRGFQVLRHKSITGEEIRLVQQSSAIGDYPNSWSQPGSSFLWVDKDHHLNRLEVQRLVGTIDKWLATGTVPNKVVECVVYAPKPGEPTVSNLVAQSLSGLPELYVGKNFRLTKDEVKEFVEYLNGWLATGYLQNTNTTPSSDKKKKKKKKKSNKKKVINVRHIPKSITTQEYASSNAYKSAYIVTIKDMEKEVPARAKELRYFEKKGLQPQIESVKKSLDEGVRLLTYMKKHKLDMVLIDQDD